MRRFILAAVIVLAAAGPAAAATYEGGPGNTIPGGEGVEFCALRPDVCDTTTTTAAPTTTTVAVAPAVQVAARFTG